MKHNVCVYNEGRFRNDQNHILEKSHESGIKKWPTSDKHFKKEKYQHLIGITLENDRSTV